jgi:hypothetical protein
MFGWLTNLFGGSNRFRNRFDLDELARRIGLPLAEIERVSIEYRELTVPKRRGGTRQLAIPHPTLKTLQCRLLHRVFGKLRAHPAACGFERGRSIVDHARLHAGRAEVIKFDLRDFFPSTTAARVLAYFRTIGWNEPAAALLTKLCTWQGALPQGAPTSPRLSNLVNYGLDVRLAALAAHDHVTYSRYADDLTFSCDGSTFRSIRHRVPLVVAEFGYRINRNKTRVMRRHQRQQVTGLVVNKKVALPRETRRRLRAIEHQQRLRGEATLSESQIAGWRAFRAMVEGK